MDYQTLTRRGFVFGAILLVIGILGEALGSLVFGPLPNWSHTLFFNMEVFGVFIGLFAPVVFGVVLPLTE